MPVSYTNRLGDEYFLQASQSKKGKHVYSFTRKKPKNPVESIPEGYEIYESPERAQVFLRKIKPTRISPNERGAVEIAIENLTELRHPIVNVEDDSLVVYTPSRNEASAKEMLEDFGLPAFLSKVNELIATSTYSKMLRFTLVDAEKRTFRAERWCFRGSIDNWIDLMGGRGRLSDLLAKYIPHLDQQSFFDLM